MSSATPCFHCGQPVPHGIEMSVEIDGAPRAMCCAGCQAVAQAIVGSGLGDYYRNRESLPETPADAAKALEELRLYDHDAVQKTFVRRLDDDEREASLILEGVTCAACIWLNEQHVSRLPGVTGVSINYATRRARVRWKHERLKLSQILEAIAAIGYRAHPYDPSRQEALARQERRDALWRLFVAGFGAMQVMMYAFPAYIAGEGEMSEDIAQLMRWASLILTVPVVVYSSAPFIRNAWRDLKIRRAGMDVPVALGVLSAFGASCWATLTASGEVYFDSVSMFVFLLLGGRYLELQARQKATAQTEALARQAPALANRVDGYPSSMATNRVAAAELIAGDVVVVRSGETLPADGVVLDGESSVDESLLTGESIPIRRTPGQDVAAGTVCGEGSLVMRVSRAGEETRLASILRLMERAAAERPHIVEVADRVAAKFVGGILVAALAVWAYWFWTDSARALWITVAVLVVTCPCALSLATPIALTVAHGRLARRGLLVTRGHVVEALAKVNHVVFDKTGTLTEGRLRLVEIRVLSDASHDECLRLAAALESLSGHPVAQAIRAEAGDVDLVPENFQVLGGQGVEAWIAGRRLRVGRADYVAALCPGAAMPAAADHAGPVAWLGDERGVLALFCFADPLRADAVATVARLRQLGVEVSILSGDTEPAVSAVAAQAGIDRWESGCSPEAKLAHLHDLLARDLRVAMVGDGVNDAPVLAGASVSIAMSGGADLAKVHGDCVLLGDQLGPLVDGVLVSRNTDRIIRQNLGWSIGYNLIAVPLAAIGWVTPWIAGVGMSGSSLLVVVNALRLRRA